MDEIELIPLPRIEDMPQELWMLWCNEGFWVMSIDDAREGQTYLVAFTEIQATNAAKHQAENYYLECVPVRVK